MTTPVWQWGIIGITRQFAARGGLRVGDGAAGPRHKVDDLLTDQPQVREQRGIAYRSTCDGACLEVDGHAVGRRPAAESMHYVAQRAQCIDGRLPAGGDGDAAHGSAVEVRPWRGDEVLDIVECILDQTGNRPVVAGLAIT